MIKIEIIADENSCSININGVVRNYEATGFGVRAIEEGDWEDDIENGRLPQSLEKVTDRFSFLPLDLINANLEGC